MLQTSHLFSTCAGLSNEMRRQVQPDVFLLYFASYLFGHLGQHVDMLNEFGLTMLHWQGKERTESRGSKLVAVGTALGLGASEYLASLERVRRSFVLVASLGPSEHLYFFSATIAFKVCSVYDFLLLSHLSSKPQWHCAP